MFKLLLVAVVSGCSVIFGVKMRSYYAKRAKLWDELYKFANFFKEEVAFKKTLIDDIYNKFNLSQELVSIKDGNYDNLPFDESEIAFISEFFDSLGRLGLTLEIENVDRYVENIKIKCNDSKKVSESKGKTSVKLGVLVGVGIFVVLA